MNTPHPSHQARRLEPKFQRLLQALEKRHASLQDNPLGIQPEKALVLETIGSIDRFVVAVRNIEGLEWLGEFELENIDPEYGFEDKSNPNKELKGQLFLVMTDQEALRQVYSLFKKWEKDQDADFPNGLAEWKKAFEYLQDVRPWGPEDRVRETGLLEDWMLRLENDESAVPFEAELWFRNNPDRRWQAQEEVRRAVIDLDGEIIQQCVIADIAYHAVLGRIPRKHVQEIAKQAKKYQDIKLLQCEGIMHVRPVGQCAMPAEEDSETRDQEVELAPTPNGDPIIGPLDGFPLSGHQRLMGRLIVDDPDGFESAYQAQERVHGTTMASLICHGDLNENNESIGKPIYVRPIMQPQHDLDGRFVGEAIPENVLAVDLIHRAVRRLYENQGGEPPAAPYVRIINFSICDRDRPLSQSMSSLARLVDWLAWKYNILFLVSAGNHLDDLRLDIPRAELWDIDDRVRIEAILKAIADDTRNRRILSPAETLNGLTVGAVHEDVSAPDWLPNSIDPFPRLPPETLLPSAPIRMPSIYSAHGPGYRRAIKPDLLLPGGRQFLSEKLGHSGTNAVLSPNMTLKPPGQCVAAPGASGALAHTRHTRGTSNAAALATRSASFLIEVLEQLRDESAGSPPPEFDPVLAKALLNPWHGMVRRLSILRGDT